MLATAGVGFVRAPFAPRRPTGLPKLASIATFLGLDIEGVLSKRQMGSFAPSDARTCGLPKWQMASIAPIYFSGAIGPEMVSAISGPIIRLSIFRIAKETTD